MAKGNKSIKILVLSFIILAATDLWSTLRFGELVQYLEANPVYEYIGLTGIIVLNILFCCFIYYWYNKTNKVNSRFYIIHIMVLMLSTRIFVIWNNLQAHKEFSALPKEKAIEIAMSITPEMKAQAITQIAAMQFMPLFLGLFTYWFFCMDHKVGIKEDEN